MIDLSLLGLALTFFFFFFWSHQNLCLLVFVSSVRAVLCWYYKYCGMLEQHFSEATEVKWIVNTHVSVSKHMTNV